MANLEAFSAELGKWMEANAPAGLRGFNGPESQFWGGRNPELPHEDSNAWCEICAERGLTAPTWPKEYGGGGLSRNEEKAFHAHLRRLKLPMPLTGFGLSMIGPTLLQYGTEEQKREHLPLITRGKIRWCQGYSEPGAGSDLASVATTAIEDGDDYVVNGQKVWTSFGDKADWMFLLTRTDPNAKKQMGITFLLMDMDQPGVEAKPIKLISGSSPFTETFFTDARARRNDVIDKVNNGWTVAKALLGHERNMIASAFGIGRAGTKKGKDGKTENPLVTLGRSYLGESEDDQIADPVLRDRITQNAMDARCFALTVQRNGDSIKAGHQPGAETSMFKVYGTELNQRRQELMLSLRGEQSLGWEGAGFAGHELSQTREWLRSRGNTIEGGTSEVQLNIIAKRVLQLPD